MKLLKVAKKTVSKPKSPVKTTGGKILVDPRPIGGGASKGKRPKGFIGLMKKR